MYPTAAVAGPGVTAATLPFTGFSVLWLLLAAITLIAVGLAIAHIVPRQEK
jgi:hypothetical protein